MPKGPVMAMMYGGGMGHFWVWPLLVVGGLALVGWALVRAASPTTGRATGVPAAGTPVDRSRDILRERFARGEISEDQLHRGLRVLDER